MLDITPLSSALVWQVSLGNDRRLEGSHLRCTGLPAASGLCLPQVQSRRRRAKKRWKTVKGSETWKWRWCRSQREMERQMLECLFLLLFCSQKPHCGWNFTLAARLLSIFGCLYFDSRFTVLVSFLAFLPQTLNNITARSVKPLWWSNTSEEVICDTCDIQSPLSLLSCLLLQADPQIAQLLLCEAGIFTKNRKT